MESVGDDADLTPVSMLLISTKCLQVLKGLKRVYYSGKKLIFSSFLVIKQLHWDYSLRFSCKYLAQKALLLALPLQTTYFQVIIIIYFFYSLYFYIILIMLLLFCGFERFFCLNIFYVEMFFPL